MGTSLKLELGGVAKVYCVHDREKRAVTDWEQVSYLGRVAGVVYDPRRHKLHTCVCCENLFVASDDTPRLCDLCSGVIKHELEAPLPEPQGAI
jgi:hypothetical protein